MRSDKKSSAGGFRRSRQPTKQRPEPNPLCARALDGLNAFDALSDIGRAHFSPRLTGGPSVYAGNQPSAWAGVLLWGRAAGYLGYKVITVIGIWAVLPAQTDAVEPVMPDILIGVKRLPFAHPFFDPEPYHRLVGRDYTLYYDDDGSPPSQWIYRAPYVLAERLAQREAVAEALKTLNPQK